MMSKYIQLEDNHNGLTMCARQPSNQSDNFMQSDVFILQATPLKQQHTLKEFAIDHFSFGKWSYNMVQNLIFVSHTCMCNPSYHNTIPTAVHTDSRQTINRSTAPPSKRKFSKAVGHHPKDTLWRHSKEPIKKPLLKKLLKNTTLANTACTIFKYIMKYMEDLPTKKHRHSTALTDFIFKDAVQNELLKDEIYCQIIKQLTDNTLTISERRGWELMWLVTGIFACSQTLTPEVIKFLHSSHSKVATDCMVRLQKTIICGRRKCPPHLFEVEAIRQGSLQCFCKVVLPNGNDTVVEVDSCTRAKDLCSTIGQNLNLKSSEGLSIFVEAADKDLITVFNIPEEEYIFDCLRLFDWNNLKSDSLKDAPLTQFMQYKVLILKKLWTNTVPGKDFNADVIFHYHQELLKFQFGYHKCSENEAAQLGALQYRVRFGGDKSEFQNIPKILKELLPNDMVRVASPEEWTRRIVAEYKKSIGQSKDEAKIAFVKIIYQWPTFGSAFFDVKQTSEPSYPNRLLIVINNSGIILLDQGTKETLATFPFTKITNWKGDRTFFHMTIDNTVGETKFICETSLGRKMVDLLNSYTSKLSKSMTKHQESETCHSEIYEVLL